MKLDLYFQQKRRERKKEFALLLFKQTPFATTSNTVCQNNGKRQTVWNLANSRGESGNSRNRRITTRVDSFGVKKNQHEFAQGPEGEEVR